MDQLKSLPELSSQMYYKSSKSPWPDKEREFWQFHPGSRHPIDIVTSGDHIGHQPYSKIRIIKDNAETFDKYSEMKKSINETYRQLSMQDDAKIHKPIRRSAYIIFKVQHSGRDATFIRGRILERTLSGTYRIYAYDDDIVYMVEQENMFKIKLEFLKLRPLIISVYLEGLEHMMMFPVFREIVWTHLDPNGEYDFIPSPGDRRLFQKHVTGTFYNSKNENVNQKIAYEFFGQPCATPELKNQANLGCRITYAWGDGMVAVQFRLAFLDQIEYALDGLKRELNSAAEVLKKADSVTIYPDVTYAVGMVDPNDKVNMIWRRAELIGDDELVVSPEKSVKCFLLDFGHKSYVLARHMVPLKDYHGFLHMIPMQSTHAKLAFVKTLDAKKFMSERLFREPTWIMVHKPAVTEDELPLITLYTRGIVGGRREKPICTRSAIHLLLANKIAEPIDPYFGIKLKLKKTTSTVKSSSVLMKKLKDFLTPEMIAPGLDEIDVGCKIQFTVVEARSETEFVIQTLTAPEIMGGLELESSSQTTKPGSKPLKPYTALPVTSKDIYPGEVFYHPCAKFISTLRVKICEPDGTDLTCRATVNVLCLDYAVYENVAIDELIHPPSRPFEEGPQAALVTHSELDAIEDMVGKRFTATVSCLNYDDYGMALIRLDSYSVMELSDNGKEIRRVMIDYAG